MRKLGVHTSIAGGICKSLERAAKLQCTTMQIFSHNPRGWALKDRDPEEIVRFRELAVKTNITPLYVHASYLINLASCDELLRKKSIEMVAAELTIADSIGAQYVILHTGSSSSDAGESARKRAASCLIEVSARGGWKAGLLLENTAGERGDITSGITDLAEIMGKVPGGLIAGICIDSCHAFAAGYDVSSFEGIAHLAGEIDKYIGKTNLKLIHLNDSKGTLGAGVDRHEHIGKGKIGIDGLASLVNFPDFSSVPMILETPKNDDEDDRKNLLAVRRLFKK